MRALIPTAGSFIETHVIESDGATSRSGDNRAPLGGGERWRRGDAVCMAYGVRARSGERGDSFSTRQPERRMRLRQSSRSLMIYHSPCRSLSLPPLCPLVFVCLSVSNIEFPVCIRGLSLFHLSSGRVRAYFWFIRMFLWYCRTIPVLVTRIEEAWESEITSCWLKIAYLYLEDFHIFRRRAFEEERARRPLRWCKL